MKIEPLKEAVAKISAKTPVGSTLRTAEWERVPLALRERAQFSAAVESVRLLQAVQDRIAGQIKLQREQLGEGKEATFDRSSFIDAIREIGRDEGLTPQDPSKVGGLQDITSIPRLGLIYDMQTAQAQGFARWKLDQSEGALLLYPAQEFRRVEGRKNPREDWPRRFAEAAQAAGDVDALRVQQESGRMVALRNSGLWSALSRFGTPWPPFDFGSGMGLEDIDRDEAVGLGLIGPNEIIEGGEQDFNDGLEASGAGLDPDYKRALKAHFGAQIDIAEGMIKWKSGKGEDYEQQRTSQRYQSQRVFRRGEEAFRVVGPAELGNVGSAEIQRDAAQEWSAQIAAVAAGRKPLFHEDVGTREVAARLAEQLRSFLPTAVVVRHNGQHLFVYDPSQIASLANAARPLWDQVQEHATDGRWLGYGANFPAEETVKVHIVDESGRRVSGFRAPKNNPEVFALARARDFVEATGRDHRGVIIE